MQITQNMIDLQRAEYDEARNPDCDKLRKRVRVLRSAVAVEIEDWHRNALAGDAGEAAEDDALAAEGLTLADLG